MKRQLIRTLAFMSVLSAVVPIQFAPTQGVGSTPFLIRLLDEQGRGLPNVRVVSDNGIVCRTLNDGSVRWTERSVMDRDVRFHLDWSTADGDVTLHPTPGGRANISVKN